MQKERVFYMEEKEERKEEFTEEQPSQGKRSFLYDVYSLLHDLAYILAAITLIFVFCVRLVGVSGASMEPTLKDGDYLALQSNVIMGDLEYGDIIVARDLDFRDGEPIVKRVIATEGQTVRIDYNANTVSVNGVVLNEPYIRDQDIIQPTYQQYGTVVADGVIEILVDQDCIFVMGDNRNMSADGRHIDIGQIKLDQVLGKVLLVVLPAADVTGSRDFSRFGTVS